MQQTRLTLQVLQLFSSAITPLSPKDRQKLPGVMMDSEVTMEIHVHDIRSKILGVIMDSEVTKEIHVHDIRIGSYYQLHNIAKLRHHMNRSSPEFLLHIFVTTRLDYCNSLLIGHWADRKSKPSTRDALRTPRHVYSLATRSSLQFIYNQLLKSEVCIFSHIMSDISFFKVNFTS